MPVVYEKRGCDPAGAAIAIIIVFSMLFGTVIVASQCEINPTGGIEKAEDTQLSIEYKEKTDG